MSISSPWGPVQHVTVISPDIKQVSTASHGGLILSAKLARKVPAGIQSFVGDNRYWEEDCDWAVVTLLFPEEFANTELVDRWGMDKVLDMAEQSVKRFNKAQLPILEKFFRKTA
jgi:hypothetical protein